MTATPSKVCFYIGVSNPSNARHFGRAMLSISRLRGRKSPFPAQRWLLDSGAFTEITRHGRFRLKEEQYADEIRRWSGMGGLDGAVCQDYPCIDSILAASGFTVREAQEETVERYHRLVRLVGDAAYVLPVLQGQAPGDYLRHMDRYGAALRYRAWVGVGGLKGFPLPMVENIILAIASRRPDLRLHGFGVSLKMLRSGLVHELLYSADSMAWSYKSRLHGYGSEPVALGRDYVCRVDAMPVQRTLATLLYAIGEEKR